MPREAAELTDEERADAELMARLMPRALARLGRIVRETQAAGQHGQRVDATVNIPPQPTDPVVVELQLRIVERFQ